MHAVAEIILPPGYDVVSGVAQVMDFFRKEDDDGKNTGDHCFLYNHARDQYGRDGTVYPGDVCTVAQIPEALTCARLIIAKPHWDDKTKVEPDYMRAGSYWNGCTHDSTGFDGKVAAFLRYAREQKAKDEYPFSRLEFGDDWQVVTVDYHN